MGFGGVGGVCPMLCGERARSIR